MPLGGGSTAFRRGPGRRPGRDEPASHGERAQALLPYGLADGVHDDVDALLARVPPNLAREIHPVAIVDDVGAQLARETHLLRGMCYISDHLE